MMKKVVTKKRLLIYSLALNKPWLYLVALNYFFTMLFVWVGNPLLPIQSLAIYGWAWHHIPEILSFFFLGLWLGSLGYLSLESFTYLDSCTLFLVAITGIAYAEIISYIKVFPIVLAIVFIPSFLGYFVRRFATFKKSRKHSAKSTFS